MLATTLAMPACERFRGPRALLDQPAAGAAPSIAPVTTGGETRRALLSDARYETALPPRGLLTFGVGVHHPADAPVPGWFHVAIRSGDRTLWDKRLNPRELKGWRDVSLPLEGLGRHAALAFELRLVEKDGREITRPADLVLAVADPVVHDLDDYGKARGVLLVSIDTLRRDHVGAYGYSKPTTPRLDALAQAGILCEDAVSTSSWTLPAHLSMLTGTGPGVHGGTTMKLGFNHRVPTLATLLREAGYATQAVTSHLYVSKTYGLDAGFDHMEYNQYHRAPQVAERGRDLLDRFGDRPFFVFLHFYDPHTPYDPPDELVRLFESGYGGTVTGRWDDFKERDPRTMPAADLAHLLALYDGDIRRTDDELRRVLDHLRERGLDKSTLVVVTSDHGEEFGEHGSWEHQKTLYEELIRIPMIVAGPGVTPRRETSMTSLLDVAPTIVGWLGLKPAWNPQGASLLNRLEPRDAYGETEHTIDATRKLFWRTAAGGKAIFSLAPTALEAKQEEWYDLARDAGETKNMPPPARAAELMRERALSRWRADRASGSSGAKVSLSPSQVDELAKQGYIN